MHWNGRKWIVAPADIGGGGFFTAVASIPHGTALAVGAEPSGVGSDPDEPLIAHWSGKTWTPFMPPETQWGGSLDAVAATSPDDIWAAGATCAFEHCAVSTTLLMHWNGKTWS